MRRKIISGLYDIWKCIKIGLVITLMIAVPSMLVGLVLYSTDIVRILVIIKSIAILVGALILLFGGIDIHRSSYVVHRNKKMINTIEEHEVESSNTFSRESNSFKQKFGVLNFSTVLIIIGFIILWNGCMLDWVLSN